MEHSAATSDGDNRANFIQQHLGHREHHLYLWALTDEMGVLTRVLNTLSVDVGADSDQVHADTAQVQNKRKRSVDEDPEEKQERRTFRLSVGSALKDIAHSSKAELVATTQTAIAAMQHSLREEETKLERAELFKMEAEDDKDGKRTQYYDRMIRRHENRVHDMEVEMLTMKSLAKKQLTLASPNKKDDLAVEDENED